MKWRCNFCLNEFDTVEENERRGPVRCPKCGSIISVKVKE